AGGPLQFCHRSEGNHPEQRNSAYPRATHGCGLRISEDRMLIKVLKTESEFLTFAASLFRWSTIKVLSIITPNVSLSLHQSVLLCLQNCRSTFRFHLIRTW